MTPEFIELKTSLGRLILNTANILSVQQAKVAGGQISTTTCLITFKHPLNNYTGIEVYLTYYELITLLDAKIK